MNREAVSFFEGSELNFKLIELFGEIQKEFAALYDENIMLRRKLGLPNTETPKSTKSFKGRVGRLVSSITTPAYSQWYVSQHFSYHQDINWSLQSHPELPSIFVTSSNDKTARVYDRYNRMSFQYSGHKGTVNNVRFHPKPGMLYCCSASGDQTCHIWGYPVYSSTKSNTTIKPKLKQNQIQSQSTNQAQPLEKLNETQQQNFPSIQKNLENYPTEKNLSENLIDQSIQMMKITKIKEKNEQSNNITESELLNLEKLRSDTFSSSDLEEKELRKKLFSENEKGKGKGKGKGNGKEGDRERGRGKIDLKKTEDRKIKHQNSLVSERIERLNTIWDSDLLTEDEDGSNFDNFTNFNYRTKIPQFSQETENSTKEIENGENKKKKIENEEKDKEKEREREKEKNKEREKEKEKEKGKGKEKKRKKEKNKGKGKGKGIVKEKEKGKGKEKKRKKKKNNFKGKGKTKEREKEDHKEEILSEEKEDKNNKKKEKSKKKDKNKKRENEKDQNEESKDQNSTYKKKNSLKNLFNKNKTTDKSEDKSESKKGKEKKKKKQIKEENQNDNEELENENETNSQFSSKKHKKKKKKNKKDNLKIINPKKKGNNLIRSSSNSPTGQTFQKFKTDTLSPEIRFKPSNKKIKKLALFKKNSENSNQQNNNVNTSMNAKKNNKNKNNNNNNNILNKENPLLNGSHTTVGPNLENRINKNQSPKSFLTEKESILHTDQFQRNNNPDIIYIPQTNSNENKQESQNKSDVSIRKSNKPLIVLKGHASVVSCADWVTPHSTINVVTGSEDNTVKLWNIENSTAGQLLSTLTAHDNAITHVSAHFSQPLILSSSMDSTFRLWDLRDSKNNVRLFKAHSATVRSSIFSKNRNMIVSASDDRTGKIWDIRKSKEPIHSFNCSSGINKISISPRYGRIIAPLDNATAHIYDQFGKLIGKLKSKELGHKKMITAADWTCDEKNILTTGADHEIIVWSPPIQTSKKK
ncbi:wd repeat-containing protein [Anaeramoeba flamelloides]|uniref:Wd repeat-containing protein n=1 Tax=Anaeramoeba flamelloides TaxID=1746091 RepID=A0ABQ8X2H1_9EUKA|nr:wd repeat-containing protein [Anaeramoeba flamelloides]